MNKIGTFNDMPLSEGMKHTINSIGFTTATPIQEKSIPLLLQGKDVLGQAQTGTGKTGAFAIPVIELVDETKNYIQALLICPTRELCLQVCQEIKRLSAHKISLESVALYGGQAIDQQFRLLKNSSPQIIVATPGRFFDHLRRGKIELDKVKMIVLDEADEMLDMGFRPEIEQIFSLLPAENQRVFFSATMPKAIKDLACTYLRDPQVIKIETKAVSASTISQNYFRIRGREKTDLLCRMLDFKEPKLALVFCNTKSTADEIAEEIKNRGFETGVLHGDLNQNQRDRVMAKFRSGALKVLVATDVAARGLDIEDVEMVFNYHLPHDPEDYIHRIGRTGRAGRQGFAFSLVEPRDNSRLRRIAQFARVEISESFPPSLAEVRNAKLKSIFSQVNAAMSSNNFGEYRAFIAKQQLSSEDIAAGMIHLAMMKFEGNSKLDAAIDSLRNMKYTGDAPERERGEGRFDRSNGRPQRRTSFQRDDRGSNFQRDDRSSNFGERKRYFDGDRKSDFAAKRAPSRRPETRVEGSEERKFGRSESTWSNKPRSEGYRRPDSASARPKENRGGFSGDRDTRSVSKEAPRGERKSFRDAGSERPSSFDDRRAPSKKPRSEMSFAAKKGARAKPKKKNKS